MSPSDAGRSELGADGVDDAVGEHEVRAFAGHEGLQGMGWGESYAGGCGRGPSGLVITNLSSCSAGLSKRSVAPQRLRLVGRARSTREDPRAGSDGQSDEGKYELQST